jgi:hypothetical protein
MTTPSTNIYVRPGWTSYTWTYNGATASGASGASAVTAVAFSLDSAWDQQVARGNFQYSLDGGASWATYVLQTDTDGMYLPANTMWRFADAMSGDAAAAGSFTMRWKLADGSVVVNSAAVMSDEQPVGLVADGNVVLSSLHSGDAVASLAPIDTGAPSGGRWVIESQSQPGLFSVAVDPDSGAAHLVVANPAAIPAVGQAVTVDMHYYDRYQLDSYGNPIAGTGVSDTLVFNVQKGTTQDLSGFGPDLALGAAASAGAQAAPAVAGLSTGGFATVWQGSGAAIWAQLRDAGGNAAGAPFAITSAGDAAAESQPAVAALSGGRFAVAYTVAQNGATTVAYRVVGADGSVGAQVAAGATGDAAMPTVTALSDGSFVVGWRSGGQVHTLHASASGAAIGGEHVFGAQGTAYSPSITGLHNGDYVVAWGEIGDGNVYAALGSSGGAIQVTADGAAASVSTAAPLPHVTALAGGGFVVAWDSYSNDQLGFSMSDIFFQRYDSAGNALGQVAQANIDSGGGRYDASVAALADGGFVIAWQSEAGDGDANGVFGRRFGSDGVAIDEHEFAVNQQAQGDQSNPDVAALAGGGFVTAWLDSQQGGAGVEARVLAGGGGGSADIGQGTSGAGTSSGSGTTSGGTSPTGDTGASGGTTGGSGGTGTSGGSGSTGTTGGSGSTGTTGGSGSTGTTGGSGSTGTSGGTGSGAVGPELVSGNAGADVFSVTAGSHAIDGGNGVDIALYQGARAAFQLTAGQSGLTVTAADGTIHDTLVNVERVQFSDLSLAFDIDGTAGQAYRLYQAAFDRAPDHVGLGFWIKMMDGGQTLDQVSAAFVSSQEFTSMYGANASDSQFVEALYQNVLHRQAESGGFDFWMAAIEEHGVSRAEVLSHFSESQENQAQVIGSIQDGISFMPFA